MIISRFHLIRVIIRNIIMAESVSSKTQFKEIFGVILTYKS
jgi:hypothetical protein